MLGRKDILAKHWLDMAHEHHRKVKRNVPFFVIVVTVCRKPVTLAKGTLFGAGEPYRGSARARSNADVWSLQQEPESNL